MFEHNTIFTKKNNLDSTFFHSQIEASDILNIHDYRQQMMQENLQTLFQIQQIKCVNLTTQALFSQNQTDKE